MNEVVAVGFDDDEGVAANDGLFTVGIAFERFARAGGLPFGAGAVEFLGPGSWVVRTVTVVVVAAVAAFFDATGDAHVIDLANAGGVIAGVFEVLRPGGTAADGRS